MSWGAIYNQSWWGRAIANNFGDVYSDEVNIKPLLKAIQDRSTYYENEAGTTALLQQLEDCELVETLGEELITNSGFDTDSDWTLGDGWSIIGGAANYDGLQASQLLRQGTVNPVIGKTYLVKYDIINNSGVGGIQVKFGDVVLSSYNAANDSFEFYIQAISTDYIRVIPQLGFNGSIDNVSVKEIIQTA